MSPTPATPRRGSRPGRVSFVGAGPGDPGLVTLRARDQLACADVVVIDQVNRDDMVLRHARPDVEIIDAGHGEHGEELTRASRAKILVRAAKAVGEQGLVVRLMDGDPAMFNGLAEEALALRKADIRFEVVPGVSAVTAVPTYAGVPLTSKAATAVHVVDAADTHHDWAPDVPDHVTVVVLGVPEHARRGARRPARRRPVRGDPGRADRARHDHRADHPRHHARRGRRAAALDDGPLPLARGRRLHRRAARGAVVVRDQAALRLERPRARAPRTRRARRSSGWRRTAPRPTSCRPSRSSPRAPRSRWSGPSRAW